MQGHVDGREFQYQPLQTEQTFRLIRLSSRRQKKYLCFEIDEYRIDNFDHLRRTSDGSETNSSQLGASDAAHPAYSALSYLWGDPTPTHVILLNKAQIRVHRNLWFFLRQLSQDHDDTLYWTDALCINQADPTEKNHQVSNMDQVYSQAARVVTWLSHKPFYEKCLSLITLGDYWKDSAAYGRDCDGLTVDAAVMALTKLDYWQRAWIVHEIALAKNVMLKCGGSALSMKYFRELLSLSSICRPMWNQIKARGDEHCIRLLDYVGYFQTTSTQQGLPNAWFWLETLQDLQCDNELDRVYSLLGLLKSLPACHRGEWPLLEVDYSKSLQVVILDWFFTNLVDGIKVRNSTDAQDILLGEKELLSLCKLLGYGNTSTISASILKLDSEMMQQVYDCLGRYAGDPKVQEEFRWIAKCLSVTLLAFTDQGLFDQNHQPPRFLQSINLVPDSLEDSHRIATLFPAMIGSRVYQRYNTDHCNFNDGMLQVLNGDLTEDFLRWCLGCTNYSICPGCLANEQISILWQMIRSYTYQESDVFPGPYLSNMCSELCQMCRTLCHSYLSGAFNVRCTQCGCIYQRPFGKPICDACQAFPKGSPPPLPAATLAMSCENLTSTEEPSSVYEWGSELTFSIEVSSCKHQIKQHHPRISMSFGRFQSQSISPVIHRVYHVDDWWQAVNLWNFVVNGREDTRLVIDVARL